MKMKKITILLAIALAVNTAYAGSDEGFAARSSHAAPQADTEPVAENSAETPTELLAAEGATELAVDLKSGHPVKPVKNRHHRIDREINKNPFAIKGETMLGITASYGTISSDDTDIGLVLDGIKLKGTVVSVKPFAGYMYRDNNCVGVRLGYSHIMGNLGNATLDLGESNDIEVSVGDMRYKSNAYAFGIYHRTYVAIDSKGRFGVFGEFELMGSVGSTAFKYFSDEQWNTTNSDIYKCEFSFNPGVAVYIFPNVCASISFGLGGLRYTHIKQYDGEHNPTGTRNYSKMRFRLNVADINFGMTLHLWNKKKDRQ